MFRGVGRFRILGGQGLEYWGGGGGKEGPNSQHAHDVLTTSMRRNGVASTSFRRRVPTRFFINQCQIIIFLILKSAIIETSRVELRGIVCQYLQIKLELHFLLSNPSTWYSCDFFLFHIESEGKCGWIIMGGGAKGMFPPLKLLGGCRLHPPPPPPLFLRL